MDTTNLAGSSNERAVQSILERYSKCDTGDAMFAIQESSEMLNEDEEGSSSDDL